MIKDIFIGNTTKETIDFTMETCCNCGIPFFMPTYHQKRLLANKGESFYCPNGHPQHYVGKTEAENLKEQLEFLRKEKDQQLENTRNLYLDQINETNKLKKQLKRVHKWICPCCNRSFTNLERHMKTKHPEVVNNK